MHIFVKKEFQLMNILPKGELNKFNLLILQNSILLIIKRAKWILLKIIESKKINR